MPETQKPSSRAQRMRAVSAEQDNVGMLLRQMGATVKEIHGLVCFVRFSVDGGELYYVYNLNADNEYYLQRVKPYPMSAGVFPTAGAIAEFIEKDLHSFENAAKSGHFAPFVDINRRLTALTQGLEDAFLHCNVPGAYFRQACADVEKMEALLREMRENALPLFSQKEEQRS